MTYYTATWPPRPWTTSSFWSALPALLAWILVRWRRGQQIMPMPAVVVIVVAAIAWTVLRNLPGFPLVPTVLEG